MIGSYKIWNSLDFDEAKPINPALKEAIDHFPVTLEIDW